jgi:transposase-like protein
VAENGRSVRDAAFRMEPHLTNAVEAQRSAAQTSENGMAPHKPRRSHAQVRHEREEAAQTSADFETRMDQAIADLMQQARPNVLDTARRHGLKEPTLRHQWKGQSSSHRAAAVSHQLLTPPQEQALVNEVQRASEMKMPIRSQHLQRFAAMLVERDTGERPKVGYLRSRRVRACLRAADQRWLAARLHATAYRSGHHEIEVCRCDPCHG